LRQEHGEQIERQRKNSRFESLDDFKRRVPLAKDELRALAELGALNCFAEHRRAAMWRVEETLHDDLLGSAGAEKSGRGARAPLAPMTLPERVKADYETMNLTTGPHPMKLLRENLPNIWRAIDLGRAQHGSTIQIAGNVICRQRPGTAKGFVFVSLEDETGVSNTIVAPDLFERFRLVITEEAFLLIEGQVQNSDGVVLIKARDIKPLVHERLVASESHDFH
jgi:error-prone DNA polymerase